MHSDDFISIAQLSLVRRDLPSVQPKISYFVSAFLQLSDPWNVSGIIVSEIRSRVETSGIGVPETYYMFSPAAHLKPSITVCFIIKL